MRLECKEEEIIWLLLYTVTYHFQHALLVIGNLSYCSRCFAFGVNASDIKPLK